MPMTREEVAEKMKVPNVVVLNVLPDDDDANLHIAGSEKFPLGPSANAFVQAVGKNTGRPSFLLSMVPVDLQRGSERGQGLDGKGF